LKTGPLAACAGRARGAAVTVIFTSSNHTTPFTASSPSTSHAAVASAGTRAEKTTGFQSNVPATLFCCSHLSPSGDCEWSITLMPFHGFGGGVTPSAFTSASTRTRAPRSASSGSAMRVVAWLVTPARASTRSAGDSPRAFSTFTCGARAACHLRRASGESKPSSKTGAAPASRATINAVARAIQDDFIRCE
jgi:hypothetical protein